MYIKKILIMTVIFSTSSVLAENQATQRLFNAAKAGDLALLNQSIKAIKNVNRTDASGKTPLMYAVTENTAKEPAIITRLIEAGANPRAFIRISRKHSSPTKLTVLTMAAEKAVDYPAYSDLLDALLAAAKFSTADIAETKVALEAMRNTRDKQSVGKIVEMLNKYSSGK